MNTPCWQRVVPFVPRPSHRYEHLIGSMLRNRLIDIRQCEKMAIHSFVAELSCGRHSRRHAMECAARHFCCSYEKVRKAVYEIDKNQQNNELMNQTIKIKNEANITTIDIEGTIGISEQWQFENPDNRVATYERFRECVSQIADISNSDIVVNIRSMGGDVNDAILIYEALRSTGAHITTRCFGYTASAATIVAQAASEGCREVASSSLYLIHNSLCSTEGNADELQAEVEMLRQTDRRLAEIYASRSGVEITTIESLMSENGGRGRWLSPAEVIEAGLADVVIGEADDEPMGESRTKITDRAMRGIKALLRALNIDSATEQESQPDINYIPRGDTPVKSTPTAEECGATSAILFDERQRSVKPTQLKEVEDPSLFDRHLSQRSNAYEQDARSMRKR